MANVQVVRVPGKRSDPSVRVSEFDLEDLVECR